jgi:hypothetical protein
MGFTPIAPMFKKKIMNLNFLTHRKILKELNYLELTPFRILNHEVEQNGLVTVLLPKFKNKFLASFVPRNKSHYVSIHLDELGSAVWLEMDGIKKVGEIIDILTEQLGEKIHPADERITKFLTNLYQNKFIGFKELQKST